MCDFIMIAKTVLILTFLVYCESVLVYSSFWAPLFNPRIVNYRVDVKYDPDSGKNARELYEKNYGYKGEMLIADLGNGKGLKDATQDNKVSIT